MALSKDDFRRHARLDTTTAGVDAYAMQLAHCGRYSIDVASFALSRSVVDETPVAGADLRPQGRLGALRLALVDAQPARDFRGRRTEGIRRRLPQRATDPPPVDGCVAAI